MKTRHFFAFLASIILLSTQTIKADEITIEAKNTDISENLELTAVANLFGQVKNLEDFEMQLNDSENKFSNLDLNNDGEVDYLRIVEEVKNDLHIIIIQAVLAPDIYQDVATILVEKEKKTRKTSVQVIGDPYIYGNNYIIEPVFIYTPIIYTTILGTLLTIGDIFHLTIIITIAFMLICIVDIFMPTIDIIIVAIDMHTHQNQHIKMLHLQTRVATMLRQIQANHFRHDTQTRKYKTNEVCK